MGIESYNPSASLNTALGAINIAEGMARADVDDAIRQLMADIASGVVPTENPKKYGAKGDGSTDDRAAIATTVSSARGKKIIFPKGNYVINSDGGSITLEEVDLIGEGVLDGATGTIDQGVNFWITGTTNSPFKMRRGSSITGIGFYYPNQTDTATPTAYPPTLAFDFTNGAVQFVNLYYNVVYNAYKFLEMADASGNVGHIEIVNNYICALNRAIYLQRNLEHLRIERNNFTFSHWLAATEGGARSYMRANATAIQVDQSDGVEIVDNLVFGQLNGVLQAATGLCQYQNISLNKFDQTRYPIKATGSGNFGGAVIGNHFYAVNPQNTSLQGRSIHIDTTGAGTELLVINGNSFNAATEDHVYVSGNAATRKLVVGPNTYRLWAAYKAAGAYGALNISGSLTSVSVTGGWFMGSDSAAYSNGIMGTQNTVQLTGATFDGCLAAVNITANSFVATGNQSFTTNGTTSDLITATANWQTGNKWDKPQGETTKPQVLARKGSAQTFNSGTMTDVSWDTVTFDKGTNFSTPNFTAPFKGRYRFDWTLTHDNTGTAGDRWLIQIITSAGAILTKSYKMIADYDTVSDSGFLQLGAAGVTAKLQVQRVGGAGNFVTTADSNANYINVSLVD